MLEVAPLADTEQQMLPAFIQQRLVRESLSSSTE